MDDINTLRRILREGRVIAVVGLSADWYRPSYFAAKYMQEHGYRVIPVNPKYPEILGEKCYRSLRDIPQKVDLVDVFRKTADVMPIAEDAITIGARVLWQNPGEAHESGGPTRVLALHAARDWLRSSFPAVFEPAQGQPFLQPNETITPRIRQLADALAVEVLNDRFLSPERLEFMLQELLLSIIETYFARRRSAARLWSGSRFEDTRIRRAL